MAIVHVPGSLRALSDGREQVEVSGRTLRQVFAAVGAELPKLGERLLDEDGELRPDIAIAIDGSILEGGELAMEVEAGTEIYLVPPIGGG